jgi:hypothetical protein
MVIKMVIFTVSYKTIWSRNRSWIWSQSQKKYFRLHNTAVKFINLTAFLVGVFLLRLDCIDMGMQTPIIHKNLPEKTGSLIEEEHWI